MMFFLYIRHRYSSVNQKGHEFQNWLWQFDQTLFPDQVSLDAFFAEMTQVADKLNTKYPRSAKILVPSPSGVYIEIFQIYPEGHQEKLVVEFAVQRVKMIYSHSEPNKVLTQEGGKV